MFDFFFILHVVVFVVFFLRFSLFWNPISIAIACHRNMREGNITNMNKNQIKFYLCVYGTQTKYYLIEIKSLFVMVYFDSFLSKIPIFYGWNQMTNRIAIKRRHKIKMQSDWGKKNNSSTKSQCENLNTYHLRISRIRHTRCCCCRSRCDRSHSQPI